MGEEHGGKTVKICRKGKLTPPAGGTIMLHESRTHGRRGAEILEEGGERVGFLLEQADGAAIRRPSQTARGRPDRKFQEITMVT